MPGRRPMDELPPFYDDLGAFRDELWDRLTLGVEDRASAFHTPALATVDGRGRPRARTVVLRAVDRQAGTLRFHCDRRSDKATEIGASGFAALLFYDAAAKLQLRVEGNASFHADDALADAAWASAQAMSRVCYGISRGPGTAIEAGGGYEQPDADEAAEVGRQNFGAVVLTATKLDLLYLDRRGHRRALWTRDGELWLGTWVAP